MAFPKLCAALALGATFVCAASASAQEVDNFARDRNTSVRERPRPGLEAVGMHAGGLLVYPRLNVDATYNDNIYATTRLTQSDWIFHISPEVAIKSNWSRHELAILARAVLNRYADHSTEDTTDYQIAANGRLDIVRGSYLSGGVSYDRATEPRTSPTAPTAAAKPIVYDLTQFSVNGVHQFNRLKIGASAGLQDFNYHNGVNILGAPLIQDDRDRKEWSENGRLEYAVSPETSVFGSANFNQRNYRLNKTALGFSRSSDGYNLNVGANFDITNLIRGEVGVGYMHQHYDDPGFKDISDFSFNGLVDWFVTPLTTVRLSGSQSIQEAVSVASPGYVSTNVGARIDHELLRQVLLSAHGEYGHDGYRQVDRIDTRWSAGVSATYLLTRYAGFRFAYDYQTLDSNGVAKTVNFKQNRVLGSVVLQY